MTPPGRRMVLDADEGIEAPLTDVVFDLVTSSPTAGAGGSPRGRRRSGPPT